MRELIFEANKVDPKRIVQELEKYFNHYRVSFVRDGVDVFDGLVFKEFGKHMHESVLEKLRAYYQLLTNPAIFQHWHLFNAVANALLDGIWLADRFQPPSLDELVLTCYIATRDVPQLQADDEVKSYVTVLWKNVYGLRWPVKAIELFWNGEPLPQRVRKLIDQIRAVGSWDREPQTLEEAQALRLAAIEDLVDEFARTGVLE